MASTPLRDLFYQIGFKVNDRDLKKVDKQVDKLDKNIQKIGKSMDNLDFDVDTRDLDRANSKVKELSNNTENLERKADKAEKKFSSLGSKLTKVLTVPIMGIGTLGTKTFTTYDDKIRRVAATAEATREEFEALDAAASSYGMKSGVGLANTARGMDAIAAAGWEVNQIIASTPYIMDLATAAGSETALTAEAITATIANFQKQLDDTFKDITDETQRLTKQAEYVSDVFAKTSAASNADVESLAETFKYAAGNAANYNQSLEKTSAMIGQLAGGMIKGSQAGTTYNAILSDLSNKGAKGIKIGNRLIEVFDKTGKMRQVPDILKEITKATAGLSDAQKTLILRQYFQEQSLRGVNTFISQGIDKYNELEEAIYNANGATQEMLDIIDGGIGGAFRRLKSGTEGLLTEIIRPLVPAISSLASGIAALAVGFSSLPGPMKTVISFMLAFAATIGPTVWLFEKWQKLTKTAFAKINNPFGVFIKSGKKAVDIGETAYLKYLYFLDGVEKKFKEKARSIISFYYKMAAKMAVSRNPMEMTLDEIAALGDSLFTEKQKLRDKLASRIELMGIDFISLPEKLKKGLPKVSDSKIFEKLFPNAKSGTKRFANILFTPFELLAAGLKTRLGKKIVAPITGLFNLISGKFGGFVKLIAGSKLGKILGKFFLPLKAGGKLLAKIAGPLKATFGWLGKALAPVSKFLKPIIGGFMKTNAIVLAITAAIGAIAAVVVLVKNNTQALIERWNNFKQSIGETWKAFGEKFKEPFLKIEAFIRNIKGLFSGGDENSGPSKISQGFINTFEKALDWANNAFGKFLDWIGKGLEYFQPAIEKVINFFYKVGQVINWVATELLPKVWDGIKKFAEYTGITKFIELIWELVGSVWGFLKTVWEGIIQFFGVIKEKLAPIMDFLKLVGTVIVIIVGIAIAAFFWLLNGVIKVVTKIIEFLSWLARGIFDIISHVAGFIADIAGNIAGIVDGLVDVIAGIFTGDWERAWDGAKQVVFNAYDAIVSYVNGMVQLAIKGINKILGAIQKIPEIGDKVKLIPEDFELLKKKNYQSEYTSSESESGWSFDDFKTKDFSSLFKVDPEKDGGLWNKLFGEKPSEPGTTQKPGDNIVDAINGLGSSLDGIGNGVDGVGKGVGKLNNTMNNIANGIRPRRPYEFTQLDEHRRVVYIEKDPSTPNVAKVTGGAIYTPEGSLATTAGPGGGGGGMYVTNNFTFNIDDAGNVDVQKLEQQIEDVVEKHIEPALEDFFYKLGKKRPAMSY